jgi:iron only hydrogenase large subunit-like protein
MNLLFPIHTEKRECQDCYRCVRVCPVKAIRVENGYASVIPERCVLCGACVAECPKHAKKVRDDIPKVKALFTRRLVYVSLAPSWVAEFPDVSPGAMVTAFRRLGFAGVSETALGAEEVSGHVAEHLGPGKVFLSTACPTATEVIRRYQPERAHLLTPLLSPVLAHSRLLRQRLGDDIAVVFVGPCISKKLEADAHPRLLDVALTFEDLRRWFEAERIDPAALPDAGEEFVLGPAREGALYPIDGGMIAGIRSRCARNDPGFMAVSGMEDLLHGLTGLEDLHPDGGLFVELLACNGGCIAGPKNTNREGTACKRYRVLKRAAYPADEVPRRPTIDIGAEVTAAPVRPSHHREAAVREVLRSLGKGSVDQEPNCGGCGYDSCHSFAVALLDGKAERAMCVTHMRRLAQKKANALIQTMPSAVVIVDRDLRILECNDNFARMFALPGTAPGELLPSMEGALLKRVVPFPHFFQRVLEGGEDIRDADLRHRESVLHGSIFTIEKGAVVGGIFYDITRPAVQKERIINKAREVIQKNLETVQQIAYLLGENAAESEITLQSIIESFTTPGLEEGAAEAAPDPTPEPPADPRNDWKRLYRG